MCSWPACARTARWTRSSRAPSSSSRSDRCSTTDGRQRRGQQWRAHAKRATLARGPSHNSGSPTWTRTRDLRINSPSLYQLSYQGLEATFYTVSLTLSRFLTVQLIRYFLLPSDDSVDPSEEARF